MTSEEGEEFASEFWPCLDPVDCIGLLKELHHKYDNNAHYAVIKTRYGTKGYNLFCELVEELDRLGHILHDYFPYRETPILDLKHPVKGGCKRCATKGTCYYCFGCRDLWCESDVDHRTHYLYCSWGRYLRFSRASYGANSF